LLLLLSINTSCITRKDCKTTVLGNPGGGYKSETRYRSTGNVLVDGYCQFRRTFRGSDVSGFWGEHSFFRKEKFFHGALLISCLYVWRDTCHVVSVATRSRGISPFLRLRDSVSSRLAKFFDRMSV